MTNLLNFLGLNGGTTVSPSSGNAMLDALWTRFLTSLGLDPSGNSPLPVGTDPAQFYQQWELYLLNSAVSTPGYAGPGGAPDSPGGGPVPPGMQRAYLYDGDAASIPANHIVSVPPSQQGNHSAQEEYLMAGYNAQQGGNPGLANQWVRVKSARVGQPPFTVVAWLGPNRPVTPLYGLIGTSEAGVKYDMGSQRFYRDVPAGPPPAQGWRRRGA